MHKQQIGVDMSERVWILRGAAILLGLAAGGIALPLFLLDPHIPRINILNSMIMVICSMLGFILASRGNINAGGYTIAGALMYCISVLPPSMLLNSPLSVTYIIAIAIGGIAGGARAFWRLSGIAIALFVSLSLWHKIWTINSLTAIFTIVMTGSIVGMIVNSLERALHDAKRLKETEVQLQKEQHIRFLIRSLQHELRAQVNGVRGLVDVAQHAVDNHVLLEDEWVPVLLKGLNARANRLEHMMQHLLIIGQGKMPNTAYEIVSLRSLITDTTVESIIGEQLHVVYSIDIADDLYIVCLPIYMQMAIDTLLRNTIEACIRHGQTTAHIVISAESDEGHLVLTIQDDGPGFPAQVVEQMTMNHRSPNLFIPSSKGIAGLGLLLLFTIVQLHDGYVEIGNQRGAWVKITLPLSRIAPDPISKQLTNK